MKNAKQKLTGLLFLFVLILQTGCSKDSVNALTVTPDKVELSNDLSSVNITINTDASEWNISDVPEWLSISAKRGVQQKATITLNAASRTLTPRKDTLTVTAGNSRPAQLIVSQSSSAYLYTLAADSASLSFKKAGSSSFINVNTDAPQWQVTSDVDWLQFSQTSGLKGNTLVSITASENPGSNPRTATITLSADNAKTIQIAVTQKGDLYPSYNTSPLAADASGMSSNAVQLAAKIKLGWNIGNTLEATGGETAWGNPRVTKALINLVKQSGFNAVRIPCSWNQYMEDGTTAKLKESWLSRVKEVVQYCVDNDMYVLLNIHWDGGWLENNCTVAKQKENNAKQKAFWEQIATYMRDFDEHLLFASANEPNVSDATQMAVLTSYHQTFIDAVRSTGGKNSYRVLVIQGPYTDIDKTNQLMTTLPVDKISNRMMAEIHFYTPWNFCGMTEDASWGKMFYYWGSGYHSTTDTAHNATWGEEDAVNNYFKMMKTQFVDKGIPVVMGEFAAMRRSSLTGDALTKHLASRAYYLKYVTQQAKANGLIPFYWDNGGTGNNASGIFNRTTNTVFDQQALDALVQGTGN